MCNYGDMIEMQGKRQSAANIALKMLKNEESLEKIHEYTEFPIDEILKLTALTPACSLTRTVPCGMWETKVLII